MAKQFQVEEVLRYFNVNVSEDDLFSRCVLCNGGSYLTVDQKTLSTLRERKAEAQQSGVSSRYCPDYDDDYDDYGGFDDGLDAFEDEDVRTRVVDFSLATNRVAFS